MTARRRGYARIYDPERPYPIEMDTTTCNHCNAVVHMHDRDGKALSGVLVHCHGCDKHICVPCAEQARCMTIEQRIERMEARGRLLAAMGIAIVLASCSPQLGETSSAVAGWATETICAASSAGGPRRGADGVAVTRVNDTIAVGIPWEQSSMVSVATRIGGVWTCSDVAANQSAEAVVWGDFDQDGCPDLVSAGEGRRLKVHWGPTWTTQTVLTAATNVQRWIAVASADIDGDGRLEIVAGGRLTGATLDVFAAPANPRDPAWSRFTVAAVGHVMSIVPADVDGDGDLDLVVSDRTGAAPGTWWYENVGTVWTAHAVSKPAGEPRMLAVATIGAEPLAVLDGSEVEVALRRPGWSSGWRARPIAMPSDVGVYHAVAIGDLTGDGEMDLVLTFSAALPGESGVIALVGPAFVERIEISGQAIVQAKFDDLVLIDVDDDGDLDVITSEQLEQYGALVYLNPKDS